MIKNKNVLKRYNLPEKVKFCKKCIISNQRPRITFDENGVCSACNFAEMKKNVKLDRDCEAVSDDEFEKEKIKTESFISSLIEKRKF